MQKVQCVPCVRPNVGNVGKLSSIVAHVLESGVSLEKPQAFWDAPATAGLRATGHLAAPMPTVLGLLLFPPRCRSDAVVIRISRECACVRCVLTDSNAGSSRQTQATLAISSFFPSDAKRARTSAELPGRLRTPPRPSGCVGARHGRILALGFCEPPHHVDSVRAAFDCWLGRRRVRHVPRHPGHPARSQKYPRDFCGRTGIAICRTSVGLCRGRIPSEEPNTLTRARRGDLPRGGSRLVRSVSARYRSTRGRPRACPVARLSESTTDPGNQRRAISRSHSGRKMKR